MDILKQQLVFNKKREADIERDANKEVEKMKTVLAFKEQELKTIQVEYQKVVNPPSPHPNNDDAPAHGSTPPTNDETMQTEDEFIRTVDQSGTPKKRRLAPQKSPKKSSLKKKKLDFPSDEETSDRSPLRKTPDRSPIRHADFDSTMDEGVELHTSVIKTPTGGVRIMIEPKV